MGKRGPQPKPFDAVWDRIKTGSPDECWEWQGCRLPTGYGKIGRNGVTYVTHRVVWELTNGSIHEGMVVCHRCDNPPCCNPNHLFLGTKGDNTADMISKGRLAVSFQLGHTKLSPEDLAAIRADKRTSREIAKAYDIHPGHVWRIRAGKRWAKHSK